MTPDSIRQEAANIVNGLTECQRSVQLLSDAIEDESIRFECSVVNLHVMRLMDLVLRRGEVLAQQAAGNVVHRYNCIRCNAVVDVTGVTCSACFEGSKAPEATSQEAEHAGHL